MKPVDRRTFFLKAAAMSAATAVSAAIPGTALAAALPRDRQPGPAWKKAPCRLCGVGCGLLVGIENGRAVAVKGDPDSPVSKGLACVKGYNSVQALYGPDRIRRALVRRDGTLVEVPLSEALDLVARKLQETTQQHGKDSVALYGSAQWSITDAYVASKLFKGALGTNNVETSTRLFARERDGGPPGQLRPGRRDRLLRGHRACRRLRAVGRQPAETDPVLFSRMLDRKRANPAVRIVDVATRTTRTSYAADHSLLHAPHTALAVANAICHEIVARKWVQREFVAQHVAFKRGQDGHRLRPHRRCPRGGRRHGRQLGRVRRVPRPTTRRSARRSCPGSRRRASAGSRRSTAIRSGR